jgi:tetratricopeptide (TPR) repeat protein
MLDLIESQIFSIVERYMKTVFLSSTAKDLAIYRDKVYHAIQRLGLHCVRMEDFGARNKMANDFCLQKVAECNLFVCLIGLCYGSTPQDSELSYTLQEYKAAGVANIPRLIFVSEENYFYPGYYREPDEQWQKQQKFRTLASTEHLRDTFTEPDELASKVVQAISNWMWEHQEEKALPPVPSKRPYHNLPHPDYTRFVGRQNELDLLRQRLLPHDRVWQIVLAGIGGVGKSALALALAHDYLERYETLPSQERFEAIIWISAKEEILTITGRKQSVPSSMIFRTLEDMYTTISQTLEREDITRALPEEQDRLVQKALRSQRTLLIVDNLESVSDERVRAFLYNLPLSTKCMITSREWIDVAAIVKLTGLSSEDAENLITEEATTRGVELNEVQRQQLFKRTEGLPLPIKLSIARIASGETFDQVLRWLGNATGDLPEYCVKGLVDIVRQRDTNAWKLLLACSLFGQDAGASREALGYVADLSIADRDDGLTMLQRLSLINRSDADRFWMLPIVQGYAKVELAATDFGEVLTERWLGWLLEFAQEYGIDLDFHVEKSRVVGADYLNLMNAIRWCREHEQWDQLLQLAEGTGFYPYLIGLFGDFREILEAALQATKALQDEQSEGRFLRRLGELFWVQAQHSKALSEYLEKAEEIALRYKDEVELGRARNIRANILFYLGYIQQAEQLAETVLKISERLNSLELKILIAYRYAEFEAEKQQFDKALEWVNQGEECARELGSSRAVAWYMYQRGLNLILDGKITDAEAFLIQSLTMADSWSERHLIYRNKYYLAKVYLDTGQLQLAHQMAAEAHDLRERLSITEELAEVFAEVEELLQNLPKNGSNSA